MVELLDTSFSTVLESLYVSWVVSKSRLLKLIASVSTTVPMLPRIHDDVPVFGNSVYLFEVLGSFLQYDQMSQIGISFKWNIEKSGEWVRGFFGALFVV